MVGMSLVTLTPDDYFLYWQEVIKKESQFRNPFKRN
jgi:hypothetical protein